MVLLAFALLAPTAAQACPIPFRAIGPVRATRQEVKRPIDRTATREAWGFDDSWTSTTPELNQYIRTRDGRTYEFATFVRQQALSIDATAPDDRGLLYGEDFDPKTPPCALDGQGEWQPPVIRIRESAQEVRVAAAAQRTVGDRHGCILGVGQRLMDWECPTLTRSIRVLKRPLGTRTLVFETFS